MNLASRYSIVALFTLRLLTPATASEDLRVLEAIAHVESGMDRKAVGKAGERGMYQIGRDAWKDAEDRLKAEGQYRCPWSKWRDATVQDTIAAAHLRTIRERYARVGILTPTPAQLALVWNVGWSKAVARNFAPNDYANRVSAVFHSTQAVVARK